MRTNEMMRQEGAWYGGERIRIGDGPNLRTAKKHDGERQRHPREQPKDFATQNGLKRVQKRFSTTKRRA